MHHSNGRLRSRLSGIVDTTAWFGWIQHRRSLTHTHTRIRTWCAGQTHVRVFDRSEFVLEASLGFCAALGCPFFFCSIFIMASTKTYLLLYMRAFLYVSMFAICACAALLNANTTIQRINQLCRDGRLWDSNDKSTLRDRGIVCCPHLGALVLSW